MDLTIKKAIPPMKIILREKEEKPVSLHFFNVEKAMKYGVEPAFYLIKFNW